MRKVVEDLNLFLFQIMFSLYRYYHFFLLLLFYLLPQTPLGPIPLSWSLLKLREEGYSAVNKTAL